MFYRMSAWSLVALVFVIPYSTAAVNAFTALVFVCWIFGGRVREDVSCLLRTSFARMLLVFLAVALLSMLWTEASDGNLLKGVAKLRKILLIFLVWIILQRLPEFRIKVVYSAFASFAILSLLCVGIYVGLPYFPQMVPGQGAIFLRSHIAQGYFLAIQVCLGLYLFFTHEKKTVRAAGLFFSLLAICVTLLMTNGRTGYVCILAVIAVVVLLAPIGLRKKGLIFLIALVGALSVVNTSRVSDRIDDAMEDIQKLEQGRWWNTSVGFRLEAWKASVDMFKDNPVFGIGLGGWGAEFCERATPGLGKEVYQDCKRRITLGNPHSDYCNWLSQFGLAGFVPWILFLLLALRSAWSRPGWIRSVSVAAVAAYMVGAVFNSFIWDIGEGTLSAILLAFVLLTLRNRADESSLSIGGRERPDGPR